MGDVKRNQWVIVLVLAAFALMVWSGYANYKRRKQYAQRQAQGTLVPETANNQSVQQDVSADEGLPDLRGKRAPDLSLRTVDGKKISLSDYKGKAVLINFWATWCAPCRAIAPSLEELATQYKGKLKIAKIDVDEAQNVAQQYGIRSIPTLLMFKGGKVVDTIIGAVPKSKLEDSVRKVI
jgi:thioredoxin 1